MDARIGSSGFSYEFWKGSFYPEDIDAEAMLAYYAASFSTVEINNTQGDGEDGNSISPDACHAESRQVLAPSAYRRAIRKRTPNPGRLALRYPSGTHRVGRRRTA
jgi:hypothetical protein